MLRLNQFFISLYNAQVARKSSFHVPFSKHTWECAHALKHIGVVDSVSLKVQSLTGKDTGSIASELCLHGLPEQKTVYPKRSFSKPHIRCVLKYKNANPLVQRIILLSTPSRQLNWDFSTVVAQSGKPGNFLLLTQHGVLTEFEALQAKIGGLPLCRLFLHPWKV